MTRQLEHRTRSFALIALCSLFIAIAAAASGQESAHRAPVLVSPGALDGEVVILDRCPSFSWAVGHHSARQELVVYRTQAAVDDSPILRKSLPAGASSWTPSAAECLEPGGAYAWGVRQGPADTLEASSAEVRLFRVADAPAVSPALSPAVSKETEVPKVTEGPSRQESPPATPLVEKASHGPLTRQGESGPAGPLATNSPSAPILGQASFELDEQIHLGNSSDFFRGGQLFLWADLAANTGLGRRALQSNSGALNVAVGDSALLTNTTGDNNAAFGAGAMLSNSVGSENSAVGTYSLFYNESGHQNSAVGVQALGRNTSGDYNSAFGRRALLANQTGSRNTAIGREAMLSTSVTDGTAVGDRALRSNSIGVRNTAVGARALFSSTTGEGNVALGWLAGYNVLDGNSNILIGSGVTGQSTDDETIRIGIQGTHDHTYIAGISAVSLSNGANVVVESDGRLGVSASSRRFKEEVRSMEDVSELLAALRPVRFRYKQEHSSSDHRPLEYGLIAEEVAEVLPELVARGDDGEPFAVRYDLLSALLLQELGRMGRENDSINLMQARLLGAQRNEIEALKRQLARLESRRQR